MVYGLGSIVADILMLSDDIKLNTKNLVNIQKIQIGGVIPSALMALSKLGIKSSFVSVIGQDPLGEILISMLVKEEIKVNSVIKRKESQTPIACVIVDKKTGARTSFYSTGEYSNIMISDIDNKLHEEIELLILDGHNIELAENMIESTRSKGMKILLDLGSPKKDLDRLIRKSDVIIVPQLYWKTVWPENLPNEIIKELVKKGPEIIVLTMDEKGSLIANREEIFLQAAFPVKVVDTNGAGDIFFGAFAYGLLKKWDIKKIANFSSAAAAISCTKVGKEYPTLSEVQMFLQNYDH